MNRKLGMGITLVASLMVACAWAHEERETDWWVTQRSLSEMLVGQKADFDGLVKKVMAERPASGPDAMFKVAVLMRAGMNKEVLAALKELKELAPNLENYQLSSMYYEAFDKLQQPDIAQGVLEIFADDVRELALDNRLLQYRLRNGWTDDRADQWLADKPAGKENFWIKSRLRFNVERGRAEPLIQKMVDVVRQNPTNSAVAISFLDILHSASGSPRSNWDLSWMAETVKPERATDCEKIASHLKGLTNWATAVTYYERAMAIPLTEKESQSLGMMCQAMVPQETLEAMFAVNLREAMSECFLKLGRKEDAQKWMVAAADIREKKGLGKNALLAGQVQAASGQRVIEGRIKEQEKKSDTDPAYWRERAQYYRGRKETAQEEDALKKGLALTTPQVPPVTLTKGGFMDWRRWMLSDYAHFLHRENRDAEAVELLHKEIETAAADAGSVVGAAYLLASDLQKYVRVDDEVLWKWLEQRTVWDHVEERLLWRMLESANRDGLEPHFVRAEKLAGSNDPSRAHTLGWIMNRMRFAKRSVPLLEDAVKRSANNKDLREKAAFTLFESYLDVNDWKQAEALFPEASRRLTAAEVTDWYGRIARSAARAGAKDDAMRIWKSVVNVNPSEMGALPDLVKAGLRDDLAKFYQDMQKRMPSSGTPARALKAIGE